MKTFLVALSLISACAVALPASAGGIVMDFPRLTYPDDSTVDTSQSCLNPTSVAPACSTPAK